MTEKLEINGRSESLFDRIWQRLIWVIPFLFLSSLIAFYMFKILSDKLGSNFFGAIALAIIGMVIIAFLISIFVGHKSKSRDLGSTLAFLIPVVVSMEAAIQFWEPLGNVIIITYMGVLVLGIFVYIFADNMLLPLVNTNNIKKEDVVCIQIFSSIADVTRLVEEVLSSLDISKVKKSGADDEKQWRFSSSNYPQYYYLYARSEGDNSVDLAFLNFTEGPNELYRSEKHEKDLNFLKEIITAKLKINNIISKSKQNTTLSDDIFEIARNKYKRKRIGEGLGSVGSRITEFHKKYPWIFLIIAALLYPIITYILKIIRGM